MLAFAQSVVYVTFVIHIAFAILAQASCVIVVTSGMLALANSVIDLPSLPQLPV